MGKDDFNALNVKCCSDEFREDAAEDRWDRDTATAQKGCAERVHIHSYGWRYTVTIMLEYDL